MLASNFDGLPEASRMQLNHADQSTTAAPLEIASRHGRMSMN